MQKKQIFLTLFAVVLVVVAIFMVRRQMAEPTMELRPSAAVGEILTSETDGLLKGGGSVVIIGRFSDKNAQTSTSEQIESFQTAIKQHPSLKLEPIEWLPAEASAMKTGAIMTDQLIELMEKHPKTGAFVIFAGLPPLTPAIIEKTKEHSVKLLAVTGYSPSLKEWLKESVLAVAVVPHPNEPPAGSPPPKTAQDWFKQEFLLLTPSHPEQWPY